MKAEFHDLNTFPVFVIALLATLTAAGCASGPVFKPRPVSAPQAGAPSAETAIQMQTSLAAMGRQLVELWQAQMEVQRLIDGMTRSCSSGGYSGMPQTMGESSQATQTDLQDLLQKQKQALHLLSQIMKQMHDTAQAIVRNTR